MLNDFTRAMLAEAAGNWLPEDVGVLRRTVTGTSGGRPVYSEPTLVAHYAGRLDAVGREAEALFNRQIVEIAEGVITLEAGAAVAPATDLLQIGSREFEVLGLMSPSDAILPRAVVREV